MDVDKRILHLSDLKSPMSLGLILPLELSYSLTLDKSENTMRIGNKELCFSFIETVSEIGYHFPGYGLTIAGEQLARLVNTTSDDDIINYYINYMKSSNKNVSDITLKDNDHQE